MELIKEFTLSVFTENQIGMLNRVTIIFTRRKLNIESITASNTEVEGIYRYTIVVNTSESLIKKVVGQLEKQIEILKALYYHQNEVVQQEIALYKIAVPEEKTAPELELVLKQKNVRLLFIDKAYLILETSGSRAETQALYHFLEPFGILEFVRSGRVAITKPMKELNAFLKEMQDATY